MPTIQSPDVTGSQTPGKFSHDMLAEQVQGISLENTTGNNGAGRLDVLSDASLNKSSSGDLNSQLHLSTTEGIEVEHQGSDYSTSARD